jgi:hypothetical protein
MDVLAGLIVLTLVAYVASLPRLPQVSDKQDYFDTNGLSLQPVPDAPDARERRVPIGETPALATKAAYIKAATMPDVTISADQRNIRLDNYE